MRNKRKLLVTGIAIALAMPGAANGDEPGDDAPREEQARAPSVSSESIATMGSTRPSGARESAAPAEAARDASAEPAAMDEILLDRTRITGNQELPKVLYIVPWQQSEAGELIVKPDDSLSDEVLDPIDRPEFIRQVDYYGDLYGETEP
jgi:hypothetical protein